jgi:rhodanese-related sulfurtransferase
MPYSEYPPAFRRGGLRMAWLRLGVLANAAGVALIREAHLAHFIPRTSVTAVEKRLGGNSVVVDARLTEDFTNGHLPGAISIPVNVGEAERHTATADLSKDVRIIVYCQSAACPFARTVAVRLIKDGFSNISIFRGGWKEWVARSPTHGGQPPARPPEQRPSRT